MTAVMHTVLNYTIPLMPIFVSFFGNASNLLNLE